MRVCVSVCDDELREEVRSGPSCIGVCEIDGDGTCYHVSNVGVDKVPVLY